LRAPLLYVLFILFKRTEASLGETKVKPCSGPDFGKLSRGGAVTTGSGAVITPEMCMEEGTLGEVIVVLDCPHEAFLASLEAAAAALRGMMGGPGDERVKVVVHLAQENVVNSPRYKEWIRAFPECHHMVPAFDFDPCRHPPSLASSVHLQVSPPAAHLATSSEFRSSFVGRSLSCVSFSVSSVCWVMSLLRNAFRMHGEPHKHTMHAPFLFMVDWRSAYMTFVLQAALNLMCPSTFPLPPSFPPSHAHSARSVLRLHLPKALEDSANGGLGSSLGEKVDAGAGGVDDHGSRANCESKKTSGLAAPSTGSAAMAQNVPVATKKQRLPLTRGACVSLRHLAKVVLRPIRGRGLDESEVSEPLNLEALAREILTRAPRAVKHALGTPLVFPQTCSGMGPDPAIACACVVDDSERPVKVSGLLYVT
jgi:hypothetical protein